MPIDHPEASDPSAEIAPPRRLARIGRGLAWAAMAVVFVPTVAWASLVVHYCLPLPASLATFFAILLPCLMAVALWRSPRPRTALIVGLAIFALGLVVFYSRLPSHERDWVPEVSVLPWAEIDGDRVVLHGIRASRYRSEKDFDLVHRSEEFEVSRMTDVDLYQVFWGSPMIAHTMFSFGFDDGRRVCLSVETRREQGEEYDAIKGFFRQFEVIYLWADETDVVRLRTDHRGEEVYRYRLTFPIEKLRAVFLEYLRMTNDLREQPQWYNALVDNCTTTLIGHGRPVVNPDAAIDWRWLANGHLHEVMYERGSIDTSVPLEQLRREAYVNGRVPPEVEGVEYSRRLRESPAPPN